MFKSKMVVMLGVLAVSPVASADLSTGLMGHWSFDDCSAKDTSGHGRDGIINSNPECVDGAVGKAFNFLGAMDENVEVDNFPEIKKSLTVSGWVNPNKFPFTYNPIVTRGRTSEAYTLWVGYNNLTLLLNWNSSGEVWCSTPIKIKNDDFSHVAATYNYNQGKISLYLNGKRVGGCDYQSELYSQTEPLYFSSSYPGAQEYFKGIIDEVRIYNRALSSAEVQTLYYRDKPPIIKGTASWITPHTVTCENTTQSATVTIPETKSSVWDCEKSGLSVQSGDKVRVTIEGTKY
jgi:hypothetical protein